MIDLALDFAAKAHKGKDRKGTDIPYIAHPYGVGVILLQAGCDEEVVVAGILHDTVEDSPVTLEDIREQFGERVASIVEGCSEPDKSLPWEERKRHSLEHLKTAPEEVRMVVCADKLHNIRSMAAEYEIIGDKLWERFNRGKEAQEWYYRGMVESLCSSAKAQEPGSIFQQLHAEVERLFGPPRQSKSTQSDCGRP